MAQSSQFDLLSAIHQLQKNSNLTYKWHWIEGHQDDSLNFDQLDRDGKSNVAMDSVAKIHWNWSVKNDSKDSWKCKQIHGELWPLFLRGEKMGSKADRELERYITGQPCLDFHANASKLSDKEIKSIDWEVAGLLAQKLGIMQRLHWIKHACDRAPTGKWMKRFKLWSSAECPRGCGAKKEDQDHIVKCPEATTDWTELLDLFHQWSKESRGPPDLGFVFTEGLNAWREDREPDFTSEVLVPDLREASLAQTAIGWSQVLKGRVHKSWSTVCTAYFRSQGSRRSGRRHMQVVISKLWDVAWDLWESRNHAAHKS